MLCSEVRLCLLEFYILEIMHEALMFDSTKLTFVHIPVTRRDTNRHPTNEEFVIAQ